MKTEKLPENVFLYVLSRIVDPESDRIRLSLLIIIALFWGEVSRPVFLFSMGVVRGFYDVVIFRRKHQRGIFRYILTFQPKKKPVYQINHARN